MWYLYLDESGDLGFDFINKNPSRFFTVTILATEGIKNNRFIKKAVKVTLRRKLNPPGKRKRLVGELKGSSTIFEIKKYFFEQVKDADFYLYTINLNKQRVYDYLAQNKSKVYNYIARLILDKIPLEDACTRVQLVIDKSKGKREIVEFNDYIRRQLEARLDPKVPLDIYHWSSHESEGLQAVDMFCWGIFEKYERQNTAWYDVFKDKIKFKTKYL